MTTSNTELVARVRVLAYDVQADRLSDELAEDVSEALHKYADALESKGEPVAAQGRFAGESEWKPCSIEHHGLVVASPSEWRGYETRLLYTAPVQPEKDERKPLSADEIDHIRARWDQSIHGDRTRFIVRETEAAHGIGSSTEGGA